MPRRATSSPSRGRRSTRCARFRTTSSSIRTSIASRAGSASSPRVRSSRTWTRRRSSGAASWTSRRRSRRSPRPGSASTSPHVWTNDPTLALGHELLDAHGGRLAAAPRLGHRARRHAPPDDAGRPRALRAAPRAVRRACRGSSRPSSTGQRRELRRTRSVAISRWPGSWARARRPSGARRPRASAGAFVDLDRELEARAGATIAELFEERGEAAFRALEEEAAHDVLRDADPAVVALGGGAVLSERTRSTLRARAFTVVLDVDPDTAWERVGGSGRPLARDAEAFRALHRERRPVYEDVGDAWATDVDGIVLAAAGVHVEVGRARGVGRPRPGRRAGRARRRRSRLGDPRHRRAARARRP